MVTARPLDHTPPDATGVDEIRRLKAQVLGTMAPENVTEYSGVEGSGNRATFTQRFVNITGSCSSSSGNEIVVDVLIADQEGHGRSSRR